MAEPLKTSAFQLPDAERVEVVIARTVGGRLIVRSAKELIEIPQPSPGTITDPRR